MALANILCRAQVGIDAPIVNVEVHVGNGLPTVSIVGLPEKAVKESKDRVHAALNNCGFDMPTQKITISLAPADLPKEGGRYDLPIALGVLAASRQIPVERLEGHVFAGELALSGELRPIRGALPMALACADEQIPVILPLANLDEAALVARKFSRGAKDLPEIAEYLKDGTPLRVPEEAVEIQRASVADFADVKGQHQARRALEIAAAGQHNILLYGPPGTGKTMLASRLPGILPPMTEVQARESAALASISQAGFRPETFGQRPIRSPHHSSSAVALVGGGSHPKPGEISLTHNGVLFLDELPEFDRRVLEVMREPLESGTVSIARVAGQAEFPARFQLVAAMNPCPCGYYGDRNRCRCGPQQIARYQRKISGPLLDRIDLHVEVSSVKPEELAGMKPGESSDAIRSRVIRARDIQRQRQGCANASLGHKAMEKHCELQARESTLLARASDRLGLSARAYHRVLKIARTIADLEGQPALATKHLMEAIQYRRLGNVSRAA